MGDEELLEVGQEENQSDAGLQNREMEQQEEQQEEAADELDVVGQQNVANPQAPAAENAPIGEIRQEITNSGGAGGSESGDPNYQEMIRGMEALEQKLKQPVPAAPADQIRIAGELRTNCAAIRENANSYIRSHKFSFSKSVRLRRRHAQAVSGLCQADITKLFIIMRNKTIQGQTTWEQVLGRMPAGINQQPAKNDAQIEAQVQAAGMQFPKAETAADFDKWGLLLETSERGGIGFGNSKYFNRVQEGLRQVGRALQERFGNVLNDNVNILAAAMAALQSLLEACMSYTARKPRTEKGKARKLIVEKLQEYAAQDMKGCSNAMDAFFRMSQEEMAAETWETVLRSARSVKISVKDFSKLQAPGGGAVSEIVKVDTETGTKYFKKEDSIDLDEFAGSDNMARDIAQQETIEKYGEIPEADKQILMNKTKIVTEKDLPSVTEKGKPAIEYFIRRYAQLGTYIDGSLGYLKLRDKGGKVNLSRRNVATSRMASLLGLRDLIAESQTVDILDEATGKTIHGNLMNQAQGQEYDDVKNRLEERKITSSFIRELTSLQVLDILCGQTDRHFRNMMYKVDANGNITGIQGIDNDAAFGLSIDAVARGASIFDISGEEMLIPYMDAHLADRIMQLDGKMLRYVLMDLLKEEEINAAIKRLEIMQKGIKNIREKEAFRFLENEEDWTVHENAEEVEEVLTSREWGKLKEREEKDPELAAKNRSRDMSVEYSFYHYSQELGSAHQDKDRRIAVAKQLYEKSDPKLLKLLLRYIEDSEKFESEEGADLAREMRRIMWDEVNYVIRKKYQHTQNYLHYVVVSPFSV